MYQYDKIGLTADENQNSSIHSDPPVGEDALRVLPLRQHQVDDLLKDWGRQLKVPDREVASLRNVADTLLEIEARDAFQLGMLDSFLRAQNHSIGKIGLGRTGEQSFTEKSELMHIRDRVVKELGQWGRAFGASLEHMKMLSSNALGSIDAEAMEFDLINILGSFPHKIVWSIDENGHFYGYNFLSEDTYVPLSHETFESLLFFTTHDKAYSRVVFSSLKDLMIDSDRESKTEGRIVNSRQRVVNHEILPAFVANFIGVTGRPIARGETGFDFQTVRYQDSFGTDIEEELQIKFLTKDSKIFNLQSKKGRRGVHILAGILGTEDPNSPIRKKLLLVQDTARDQDLLNLRKRCIEAGIAGDQITILSKSMMALHGLSISAIEQKTGELKNGIPVVPKTYVQINVDFVRAQFARSWLNLVLSTGHSLEDCAQLDIENLPQAIAPYNAFAYLTSGIANHGIQIAQEFCRYFIGDAQETLKNV